MTPMEIFAAALAERGYDEIASDVFAAAADADGRLVDA